MLWMSQSMIAVFGCDATLALRRTLAFAMSPLLLTDPAPS
jgi:hypothetical protein